ncbi:type VII secretion protein EccB [Micromonospora sp. DR5-3]|uniref:type VII secretion protein EccB n=1 Tax=unclassified Micromonospora TaxID=2617518 RepID=UPI0011DB732E|nr:MULTISPECIES: type VII secretion protein EccB [unclassified Micromonospora]MCW3815935.1 type VII secretion protein EccB [Micromonospora sp. DR5-3]TYC24432.1 type VII secretion protein EccB [Micromonospora sp. MP36]
MWTQRDQLQAYQFLRRRLVSALQVGDANHPVSPSRRLVIGCALGAAAALLVTAGFGVYGFLRPGANTDWRKPGRVVIEKDTGAVYVMGADGLLHPMLNYASARLLAGGDGTATSQVSSKSLAGAPRGVPLGIPAAPSSLPPRDRLLAGPFTVCAQTAPGRPAGTPPVTTALAGVSPAGTAVNPASALVVAGPDGVAYALVSGRRHRIVDQATAVALGYDAVRPLPVSAAWLNAVTAGPDLRLRTVDRVGAGGPRVGDRNTRVGQVLVVANIGAGSRYYLVRADGLLAIGQTEAALVLGNPANRAAYPRGAAREIQVTAADVAESQSATGGAADYPARLAPPVETPPDQVAICATMDGDATVIRLGASTGVPAGAAPIAAGGGARADAVFVPAGRAAVLRERPAPQAALGAVYLLTDQGMRYPVPDGDALKALGFGEVSPTPVPPSMLALFPTGPVLDPAAAQRPVPPDAARPSADVGETTR